MEKKIKVVWLTQFSNSDIRAHLPLELSLIQRFYYCIRGFHAATPVDRFPWNTNMLIQAEKLLDKIDLYVVCPYRNIRRRKVSFSLRGINYVFIKDQGSESVLNFIKKRFAKNPYPIYKSNWIRLENEINKIHPDIIHLIGAENVNYSPAIINLSKRYKTIVQLQTLMIDPEFRNKYPITDDAYTYRTHWEELVLKSVHYVGTNSPFFEKIIKERLGNNIKFLDIELPEGEMADRDSKVQKEFDFEYHAFDIEKAALDALEAFAITCKKHPDITLDVIGGFSNEFKCKIDQRLVELGINNNVIFEGRFETIDEVKKQVKKSRFSVVPLRIDYISSSIIESMALGNPVVSTITSGTPTLNRKRHSVLLSPIDDYKAMADNMCNLLEDELFALEMRENAFLTIEELYNHFAIINKWIDTYYQLYD